MLGGLVIGLVNFGSFFVDLEMVRCCWGLWVERERMGRVQGFGWKGFGVSRALVGSDE